MKERFGSISARGVSERISKSRRLVSSNREGSTKGQFCSARLHIQLNQFSGMCHGGLYFFPLRGDQTTLGTRGPKVQ